MNCYARTVLCLTSAQQERCGSIGNSDTQATPSRAQLFYLDTAKLPVLVTSLAGECATMDQIVLTIEGVTGQHTLFIGGWDLAAVCTMTVYLRCLEL